VSGLLLAFALPPLNLSVLAWAAFIPLFWAAKTPNTVDALAGAYACGLVLMGQTAYGLLAYSPHICLLFVVVLPLWIVITVGLYRWVAVRERSCVAVVAGPTLWVAVEVGFQEILRLPLDVGLTQARSLLPLQTASLWGTSGLSFLIILTGVLGAKAVEHACTHGLWRARFRVLSTVLVPGCTAALGWWVLPSASGADCVVRAEVAQPAIPFGMGRRSWTDPLARRAIRDTFEEYVEGTRHAAPPFFFWPEGGGAFENFRVGPARGALLAQAARGRQHLIVSAVDFDERGRKFNSVFAFTPDQRVVKYDKMVLVPHAEADTFPGRESGIVDTKYGSMGLLVCFESYCPHLARVLAERGAAFLAVSTSDAAFGLSNLPDIHLSTSVARAVETRRSVVHASNGGPSAFIDPAGRIASRTPLWAKTLIEGCIITGHRQSVFTRVGYLFRTACVIGAAALLALATIYRLRGREQRQGRHRAAAVPTAVALTLCALGTLPLSLLNMWVTARHAGLTIEGGLKSLAARQSAPSTALRESAPSASAPTALAYLASFYGVGLNATDLFGLVPESDTNASLDDLAKGIRHLGFEAIIAGRDFGDLGQEAQPLLVRLAPSHFAVTLEVRDDSVVLFNPIVGIGHVTRRVFEALWDGAVLRICPPAVDFAQAESEPAATP
jgi:apolipoprotein N-acyltransferase